jgi:hypothetical protein
MSKSSKDCDAYEFEHPTAEYCPNVFWFLNEGISKKTMRNQLCKMRDKGIFQPVIVPWEGLKVSYLSDEWFEKIRCACEIAEELGMTVLLYDELNWPSGYAGGILLKHHPDYRSKCLTMNETEVYGPLRYRASVPVQFLQAVVVAKIESDSTLGCLIDLTDKVKDGELCCHIPSGRWKLMFFGIEEGTYQPPFSKSFYPDLLEPRAVRKFIELTHERYYEKMPGYFGSVIKGIFTDEPGMYFNAWWFNPRSIPWTPSFLGSFRKRKRYDLRKYLPTLWYPLDDEGQTTRVRADFFDVLGTLYQESYFKTLHDWCSTHGVSLMGHILSEEDLRFIARLEADYFKAMRYLEIPGVDNISDWGKKAITPKMGSSVAHAFDRPLVFSETFALFGWSLTFELMKAVTDWQFARGINRQLVSAFFYSIRGKRKHCVPPSIYQNVFWPYFRNYSVYTARLGYMLTHGRHVAPVAILLPMITVQSALTALDLSEASRLSSLFEAVSNFLLENQYDFDYLDESLFDKVTIKKSVAQPLLQLGDEGYSVLILPGNKVMSRTALKKIRQFRRVGGTVIALKQPPAMFADGSFMRDVLPVSEIEKLPEMLRDFRDIEILNPEGKKFEVRDEVIRGGCVNEGYVAWIENGHELGLLFEVDSDCFDSVGCDVAVGTPTEKTDGNPEQSARESCPSARLLLRKVGPTGQVLVSRTFEQTKPSRLTLEFEPLPKGRYYLQLKNLKGILGWWSRDFNEDNRTVAYADEKPVRGHDRVLDLRQINYVTNAPFVNYLHLMHGDRNVYFITNSAPFDVNLLVAFGIIGTPELWDAETGEKKPLYEFRREGDRTVVRLVLSKYGSTFVVFSKGKEVPHVISTNMGIDNVRIKNETILVDATAFDAGENFVEVEWKEGKYRSKIPAKGPQIVEINEWNFRAPGYKGTLKGDWSTVLPFFSGTGVYSKEVSIAASMLGNMKVLLDCDNAANIMELKVNQKHVGVRCWPPYRFDVTPYIKPGKNRIKILVTNTSANSFDHTPVPSGLLAPVRIRAYESHSIQIKTREP